MLKGIKVKRLTGYLELLRGQHGTQSTHVVETVGYLDQDHPDIVAHRQQQLTEILCLRRRLFAEDTAGYLRQAIHDLGDLLAEHVLNILDRIFGILHHVVQKAEQMEVEPSPISRQTIRATAIGCMM